MASLDSVLSFSCDDDTDQQPEADAAVVVGHDNGVSSDDDDAGFEFAFAPPLGRGGAEDMDAAGLAPADDLFAHGRILPAYPVLERAHNDASHQTAPPSPDTYCSWAPRSAPGSPARGFPTIKSASTGEARRGFWRLPGLGGGGRSHSDGKEKFVFLQPGNNNKAATANKQQDNNKPSSAPPPLQEQKQKQSKKKKGKAGAVTEMDMATAHRLFYGKQGGAVPGAADRRQHSYLPYRTGIVGFFATAHALGKSHHPY